MRQKNKSIINISHNDCIISFLIFKIITYAHNGVISKQKVLSENNFRQLTKIWYKEGSRQGSRCHQ